MISGDNGIMSDQAEAHLRLIWGQDGLITLTMLIDSG